MCRWSGFLTGVAVSRWGGVAMIALKTIRSGTEGYGMSSDSYRALMLYESMGSTRGSGRQIGRRQKN